MEKMRYCKTRKTKSISRAHAGDAGIDFYVPEDIPVEVLAKTCETTGCQPEIVFSKAGIVEKIILEPGESVLIPSGIHVKLKPGWALVYFNKSGVASKRHLDVMACVVDSSYQGECHINLVNTGKTAVEIEAGDKIVQGLLLPVSQCQTEEVASLGELYPEGESDRGAGGFGSSGTK